MNTDLIDLSNKSTPTRCFTDSEVVKKTIDMLEHTIEQMRRDITIMQGKIEATEGMLSNIKYWQSATRS